MTQDALLDDVPFDSEPAGLKDKSQELRGVSLNIRQLIMLH
jgi:hypothetical protein